MKKLTYREICEMTRGTLLAGDPFDEISDIAIDSRQGKGQSLFIPIKGENTDGHQYIEAALLNGFSAVLTGGRSFYESFVSKYPGEKKGFILVEDTVTALQDIGKNIRRKCRVPAIGVTGSVGKTTTREMIYYALSGGGKIYKTDHNYNNRLGVPLTLAELTDDYDMAVLELGMNVPGELGTISALTDIETAVITNIGVAHMEYYGSQEKIRDEKFTVTKGFFPENQRKKVLFLNGDDPLLYEMKTKTAFPAIFYGLSDRCDYYGTDVTIRDGKTHFVFHKGNTLTIPCVLSVYGLHNVLNAVCALAICDYYGRDLLKAAESLGRFQGFSRRLQRFQKGTVTIIDDTYNASPASMKAGLTVLSDFDSDGRKIAVLGDMFELGEKTPEFHYEVGEYAGTFPFDAFYLVGEMASLKIREGILKSNPKAIVLTSLDRDQISEMLKKDLRENDVIYIKASNGMRLHEIREALMKDE